MRESAAVSKKCLGEMSMNNLQTLICLCLLRIGAYSPIAWQSRKIRRTVKSTIAAESLAALDAAEMTVFLVSVLRKLILEQQRKLTWFVG